MEETNISQEQNPLGTAPVGGLIGKFAIPAIISMLVSAMYNIVDQIFIGQGVGRVWGCWEMQLPMLHFL